MNKVAAFDLVVRARVVLARLVAGAMLLALAAAATVVAAPEARADGTVVYESTPNGSTETANPVPLGVPVEGVSSNSDYPYTDADFYKYEVPSAGKLSLNLTFPSGLGTGDGFDVSVYNSSGNVLFDYDVKASQYDGSVLRSRAMYVGPGTIYVRVYSTSSRTTFEETYRLTATHTPMASETEFNNSTASADALALGATVFGATNYGDYPYTDKDYFAVEVPSSGQLVLDLKFADGLGTGDGLDVDVYTADGTWLYAFDVGASQFDGSRLRSKAMFVGAGTYYVSVYGNSNRQTWAKTYALSVSHRPTPSETEFNDGTASADALALGQTLSGSTAYAEYPYCDSDYYQFELAQAGEIDLILTFPSGLGTGNGYDVTIYNKDGNKEYDYDVSASAWDGTSLRNQTTWLSSGRHYLRISSSQSRTTWYQPYKITVGASFTSVGTPSIVGTAAVGSTLTAKPGTSSPTPTSHTYQWLRNGVAIQGATSASYKLKSADGGSNVSVQVTPVRSGYASTAKVSASVVVTRGYDLSPTPTITGAAKVGSALTVALGTWSPKPDSLAYQWYRDGVAIGGATSYRYTPTTADAGHQLSVKATALKAGYPDVARASARVSVPWLVFSSAPVPSVTGTVKVGSTLKASVGTWSPAPTAYGVQWYRDGVKISGATSSSYTLTAADAGRQVSVAVTGSRAGYKSVTVASSRVNVPWSTFTTAPTPTITGTLAAGNKVTVNLGSWSPKPETVAYQWYRDGVAISGAKYYQYTLSTADAGRQISVAVTASKPGYKSVTKASARASIANSGA